MRIWADVADGWQSFSLTSWQVDPLMPRGVFFAPLFRFFTLVDQCGYGPCNSLSLPGRLFWSGEDRIHRILLVPTLRPTARIVLHILWTSIRQGELFSLSTRHIQYSHIRTLTPTPTHPGLALMKNTLRCATKSYTKVPVPVQKL